MALDIQARGIDLLAPIWHFIDLTPQGRGDWYTSLDYGTTVPARQNDGMTRPSCSRAIASSEMRQGQKCIGLAHREPTQNFEKQQLQEAQAIVGTKIRRASKDVTVELPPLAPFRILPALRACDQEVLPDIAIPSTISIASFSEAYPCGICVPVRRARGRNGTE